MSGILFRTSHQSGMKPEPSTSLFQHHHQHDHNIRSRRDRSSDRSSVMSDEFEPPKKKRVRARLDHLTPSEKLQRRKMKNRIAAQTARDRKRLKIDHLEEENRKLREENEILKSQLKMSTTSSTIEPLSVPMLDDSGVSDNDSIPKTSTSVSMAGSSAEMDLLVIPQDANNKRPSSPSGGSSTSGAYSNSPEPDTNEYLDSVVGEADESKLIDDILKLQDSLFSGPGNDVSLVSAVPINAPQQQVQDASFQSLSVENSAGWTSIQLMLLLMITRAHRLFSSRINCCATTHEKSGDRSRRQQPFSNIYDYIHEAKCAEFKRSVDIIISNKNNVRQQKFTALHFLYKYVYHGSVNLDSPFKPLEHQT